MSLVSLYGHAALQERFARMVAHGTLPSSLLIQGPRGVGKQRLALWLAQILLCSADERPCGVCAGCKHALQLTHPDLYWVYPRPRLKDADSNASEVFEDYAAATAERAAAHGLYAPPPGTEGLYIATVRAIVQRASISPAMGRRKIFVVGEADRMVSQEGADQAANAFLKLLEEPPADTTVILTSSEPGALLPTIRSRVIAFRCGPLLDDDVRAFVQDPIVKAALDARDVPGRVEDRITFAAGMPGILFAGDAIATAHATARAMLQAALRATSHRDAERYSLALSQGSAGARGAFADTLDALTMVLRDRARDALAKQDAAVAYGASRGIDAVLRAQSAAEGNVNPQLVTARLLSELEQALR